METISTYIAFAVAILGLSGTVLSLILYNKQIRRENHLERERLEKENQKKLEALAREKEEEARHKEVLQMAMNIVTDFMKNELSAKLEQYVKAEDLQVLDAEWKTFVEERLRVLNNVSEPGSESKKRGVEKTLDEIYSGHNYGQIPPEGDFGLFLRDRAERRINRSRDQA